MSLKSQNILALLIVFHLFSSILNRELQNPTFVEKMASHPGKIPVLGMVMKCVKGPCLVRLVDTTTLVSVHDNSRYHKNMSQYSNMNKKYKNLYGNQNVNRKEVVQFDYACRDVSNGWGITWMPSIVVSSTLPGSPSHSPACDGTTAHCWMLPHVYVPPCRQGSVSYPAVGGLPPGSCSGSRFLRCTNLPLGDDV